MQCGLLGAQLFIPFRPVLLMLHSFLRVPIQAEQRYRLAPFDRTDWSQLTWLLEGIVLVPKNGKLHVNSSQQPKFWNFEIPLTHPGSAEKWYPALIGKSHHLAMKHLVKWPCENII